MTTNQPAPSRLSDLIGERCAIRYVGDPNDWPLVVVTGVDLPFIQLDGLTWTNVALIKHIKHWPEL